VAGYTRLVSTDEQADVTPVNHEPTRLLDAKAIQVEYGLSESTAYAVMRLVGCVDLSPDVRKLFVWRDDLERYLRSRTSEGMAA
jgi:hypothetical protein